MFSYQFHIGDFNRETRHLSRLERGIYRDLLDIYYETERPIVCDINKIFRLVMAITNEERTSVEQVLNEFFHKTERGYVQVRCELEIERYKNLTTQKSVAGKLSAAKRAEKRNNIINGCSTSVGVSLQQNVNGGATNQLTIEPVNHRTNINTSCSEPKVSKLPLVDDSPVFICIPTNKFNTESEERPITANKISEWQAIYPGISVKQTLMRIRGWAINNPKKRKTYKGTFAFIDKWLAKEQNSGGSHAASQQSTSFGPGPAKIPHADLVRGQARRAFERINGVDGAGSVYENGGAVSQQSPLGRADNLPR